jgi:MoaA/NifB/PqqE/SkfB family radical SAM enzyme|tara:strand:+ start:3704 stop:4528 length:825 start_codon:yes stop_codon:yes gene_type:complete
MKSWKDLYDSHKLTIFVDISTYCNAGCPQCHRTDFENGGLRKVGWLPLIRWSLQEFKEAYDPELIRRTDGWEICGTWGDPIMCKEMYEIAEYILTINPRTELTIDTNGSVRPLSWWKKFGELSSLCVDKGIIRCDFAVEGINQEMHAHYRRLTDLSKVLANMKAFTDAGGKAKGFCVVHRHNQDYLQEIMDLCQAHGAMTVDYVENNRFYDGPSFEFTNEYDEIDEIEQIKGEYKKPKYVRDAQSDWKTRVEFNPALKEMVEKASQVDEEEDIH